MLNDSRHSIYDYLYGLFYETVTPNVYLASEPQELTNSDMREGFVVLNVGDLVDESEFAGQAFGGARCFVRAFTPAMSRGRMDDEKYAAFESAINAVIKEASANRNADYFIQEDSVLSYDDTDTLDQQTPFYILIKSFIVITDKQLET